MDTHPNTIFPTVKTRHNTGSIGVVNPKVSVDHTLLIEKDGIIQECFGTTPNFTYSLTVDSYNQNRYVNWNIYHMGKPINVYNTYINYTGSSKSFIPLSADTELVFPINTRINGKLYRTRIYNNILERTKTEGGLIQLIDKLKTKITFDEYDKLVPKNSTLTPSSLKFTGLLDAVHISKRYNILSEYTQNFDKYFGKDKQVIFKVNPNKELYLTLQAVKYKDGKEVESKTKIVNILDDKTTSVNKLKPIFRNTSENVKEWTIPNGVKYKDVFVEIGLIPHFKLDHYFKLAPLLNTYLYYPTNEVTGELIYSGLKLLINGKSSFNNILIKKNGNRIYLTKKNSQASVLREVNIGRHNDADYGYFISKIILI